MAVTCVCELSIRKSVACVACTNVLADNRIDYKRPIGFIELEHSSFQKATMR